MDFIGKSFDRVVCVKCPINQNALDMGKAHQKDHSNKKNLGIS